MVGLLLVLALLVSWALAARRATHPLLRKRAYGPERVGMLSMLCVVVVFGLHSLIDWTWYVPGDACVALFCAAWLAGRGELGRSEGPREPPLLVRVRRLRAQLPRARAALAGAVLVAALLAAWAEWQPQRADEARGEALALAEGSHLSAANSAAQSAVSRDPLSIEALFALAEVQQLQGHAALARASLQRAVRLQPSNPQPWLELARHDLSADPSAALKELEAAIYLNPESIASEAISGPAAQRESIEIYNDYIQALRASGAGSAR